MAKAGSVAENILLHHDNNQNPTHNPYIESWNSTYTGRVHCDVFSRTQSNAEAATGSGM